MTSNPKQLGLSIAGLVVGLLLLFLIWRQQSDLQSLRSEYARLAEQKLSLEASLRQNAGAAVTPAPQPNLSQPSAASETSVPPDASHAGDAHPSPAVPEPNRLALKSVSAKQQGDGITASMVFKPTTTNALADVWVVVRLPRDSGVKVLDIGPGDSTQYTNVGKRVAEDGKFAIFQGRPIAVNPMKFDVSVSGPVTASVRGTCGIERFSLEISATGAKVRGE